MAVLKLLSGGAAQSLVNAMKPGFATSQGVDVEGTFGAVGAMRDRFLGGDAADVIILTQAIIDQLIEQGHLVRGSARPLGVVKTGVAVKSDRPLPGIATAQELKAALQAASGIYFPDPEKATAGIHFMKVLKTLGVDAELASRLRTFPNGATAMREMVQVAEPDVIGCTQVTEILYTQGVRLAGLLPQEFELATVYTAAVSTKSQQPQAAEEFVRLLASREAEATRTAGGFEHG